MIKLIAIGNRFMSDDGIAIKVAEKLENKLENLDIEIIIAETDYQTCFNTLNEDDFIIILDALYTYEKPGSIYVFNFEEALNLSSSVNSQHDMSIIDLMKIYERNFKGYIIGIEVNSVDYGDTLSPMLKEKFSNICSKVELIIKSILLEEMSNA